MSEPSCGFCITSDCRGNKAYVDSRCPEHGIKYAVVKEGRHIAVGEVRALRDDFRPTGMSRRARTTTPESGKREGAK